MPHYYRRPRSRTTSPTIQPKGAPSYSKDHRPPQPAWTIKEIVILVIGSLVIVSLIVIGGIYATRILVPKHIKASQEYDQNLERLEKLQEDLGRLKKKVGDWKPRTMLPEKRGRAQRRASSEQRCSLASLSHNTRRERKGGSLTIMGDIDLRSEEAQLLSAISDRLTTVIDTLIAIRDLTREQLKISKSIMEARRRNATGGFRPYTQ